MQRNRAGWSKLDLLVCVILIGMLMMLILPALQRNPKEFSRQQTCLNNMGKNLALAHNQFATQHGHYCGYVNDVGPDHKAVSWVVPLFPYIDRGDLWLVWSTRSRDEEENNFTHPLDPARHPNAYIELLICPNNPPADEKNSPLSYVVNGGYAADQPPECGDDACTVKAPGTGENPANGVFHDHYGPVIADNPATYQGFNAKLACVVTPQFLANNDGARQTIMLSENVQLVTSWRTPLDPPRAAVALVWFPEADSPGAEVRRINVGKKQPVAHNQLDFARPSSYHAGGVNVAFCDGHGKFISETIDYKVYKQLMTPAGVNSGDQENLTLNQSMY